MGKRILFIHGRSFKPKKKALWNVWLAATRHGIARSYPRKLRAFEAAKKEFAYYGDHTNPFLRSQGRSYSESEDIADRKATLAKLKQYPSHEFTKRTYENLPGKSSLKEFFADVGAGPLRWFGLSDTAISAVAPDMREYWNPDSRFGSTVRWAFTEPLRRAMDSGDKILVIAHSLGTLISWDTFWKFSYYGEYQAYRNNRIDLWITIGSPLADETVKGNLKGARARGARRFPANVVRWENITAEDDYISHDQTVANDFKEMLRSGLATQRIRDHHIYNLAVRGGSSNPHSSVGYLVHPKTAQLVAQWL